MNDTRKIENEIIGKIQSKWSEITKKAYIQYSIKELAYNTAETLLEEYLEQDFIEDIQICCRKYGDKFKIAFEIEEGIYMKFDIWWNTSWLSEACSLKIGNGKLANEISKYYKDIEEVIEDIPNEVRKMY